MHESMAEFPDGGWHMFSGLPGTLSLIFIAVIIVGVIAVLRDWQRGDG